MRVLVAMDSFKGSLSSIEAVDAVAAGIRDVYPNAYIDKLPLADGGEGTIDAFLAAVGGFLHKVEVSDPLGKRIESYWAELPDGTGIIEMAAASGLSLVKMEAGLAMNTCSYGTGELILDAITTLHKKRAANNAGSLEQSSSLRDIAKNHSANGLRQKKDSTNTESSDNMDKSRSVGLEPLLLGQEDSLNISLNKKPKIIIGIGGSATNDCGVGALRALGLKVYDSLGKELAPGGASLINAARIDASGLNPLLLETEIIIACDVTNPLCGYSGASHVFGPQKGASLSDAVHLDASLLNFAKLAGSLTGKNHLETKGAGAAGGIGAGLLYFTNAKLSSGIEIVLGVTDFKARARCVDIVVTGEGRTDSQTIYGKAPVGVAMATKDFNKPVVCVSGSIEPGGDVLFEHGISGMLSAVSHISHLDYYMKNAEILLRKASRKAFSLISIGQSI